MESIFRVAFAILQHGQAELMEFDMEGMLRVSPDWSCVNIYKEKYLYCQNQYP